MLGTVSRAVDKTAGPWSPHWPGGDRYSHPFHKTTWWKCYTGDALQGLWNKLDQLYQGGGRGRQEKFQKARRRIEVCTGMAVMGVAHCRVQSSAWQGRKGTSGSSHNAGAMWLALDNEWWAVVCRAQSRRLSAEDPLERFLPSGMTSSSLWECGCSQEPK